MSSLLNTYDQIGKRIQYFISVASTTIYTVNSGASVSSLMTTAEFTAATSSNTKTSGTIYRDTGKIITIYDSEGQHVVRYAKVQEVNGADTEGVPGNYNTNGSFYIPVWSAYPGITAIKVARFGAGASTVKLNNHV